jgi:uncharacterized protein (TIGR02145 family)
MKKELLLFIVITLFIIRVQSQTVTDIDGNVYNTVTIGNQIWMKENLRVTHSNDGGEIQNITDSIDWAYMPQPAFCNYNNDTNIANEYGILYNWYAVGMLNSLCPLGWHVPSQNDWVDIETYLGGDSIAGGKMKETGNSHWQNPNIGATNSSDFLALPGGKRIQGTFSSIGFTGYWWSITDAGPHTAWMVYISNSGEKLYMNAYGQNDGLSVRCLCDSAANSINEINFNKDLRISPNPFSQSTQITLNHTYHNIALAVYDIQGKLLLQQQYKDCDKIQLSRNQLSNGLYFLKLTLDDKEVETGKMVIGE